MFCECGCGGETKFYRGKSYKYLRGHNNRGRKIIRLNSWNDQDTTILCENFSNKTNEEIQKLFPSRSLPAIRCRASELNLHRNIYKINVEQTKIINISEPEISYIAGFFDGEGNIAPYKTREKWYVLRMTFSNTNMDVINFIKSKIGGHISTFKVVNCKRCYNLSITGMNRVFVLAKMILPYSIVKKQQLQLIIDYCNNRFNQYSNSTYSENEVDIINKIKQLTKRGDNNENR